MSGWPVGHPLILPPFALSDSVPQLHKGMIIRRLSFGQALALQGLAHDMQESQKSLKREIEEVHMDLLQTLLGGGQQRQEYEDFINRYDQGSPYDGISDQEAIQRYQQVAPQVPHDVYQQAAQDAFGRMSPQERMQFGQHLQQQARQQNMSFPDLNRDGIDDRLQDPNYLAQVTGQMHQQQPNLLSQLLGGGGVEQMMGGLTGNRQMNNQNAGGLLNNPLAKAALAGIAAMAVKRMMQGGGQAPPSGRIPSTRM